MNENRVHSKYTYFLRFEIGHDKYADAYEIAIRKIILAIHSFNIAIDQSPSFFANFIFRKNYTDLGRHNKCAIENTFNEMGIFNLEWAVRPP